MNTLLEIWNIKKKQSSVTSFSAIYYGKMYMWENGKKNISRQSAHCKQKENVIHLLFWMLKCWKHMDVVSIFSHSKYKNTMEAYCGWLLSCKKRKKKTKCLNLLIAFSAYRTAKQENKLN